MVSSSQTAIAWGARLAPGSFAWLLPMEPRSPSCDVRHHGDVDWMMIRRAPGRGRREPSTVSRSIRAEVDASG